MSKSRKSTKLANLGPLMSLVTSLALLAGCSSGGSDGPAQSGSLQNNGTPTAAVNVTQTDTVPPTSNPAAYVAYLQRLAKEQGAPWTPQLNEIFVHPSFNFDAWLGAFPEPAAPQPKSTLRRDLALEATMPKTLRWDRKDGKNFMTPVKTQTDPANQDPPRDFGTCVAFATTACLEGKLNILADNPKACPDLSEWYLYSRSGNRVSTKGGGGWDIGSALSVLQREGTVLESVVPYNLIPSIPGVSNASFRWSVSNVRKVPADITSIKQELLKGPVVCRFDTYQDLWSLDSRPYRKLAGVLGTGENGAPGGHAVCMVGWDDTDNSWVCKNSWGTNWGDRGYFKIVYGQVGIEQGVFAFDVSNNQLPPSTVAYVGSSSTSNKAVYVTRRASGRKEEPDSPALGLNAELSTSLGLTPDASVLTHMQLKPDLTPTTLLSTTWNFFNTYQILDPSSSATGRLSYSPAWSKDGDKLAFIEETSSGSELRLYQLSPQDNNPGFKRTTRAFKSGALLRGVSFSPDGQQVVTGDRTAGPGGNLMVVNVTDGSSMVIKQGTSTDLIVSGDWSGLLADGSSKILFTRVSPGPVFKLFSVNPDGSQETLIAQQSTFPEATWVQTVLQQPSVSILAKIGGVYSLGRHNLGPTQSFSPLKAFQLPGEPSGQAGAKLYLNPNDTNL